MVDVEELLDGVPVRLAPAQAVRARGERRRTRQKAGLAAAAVVAVAAVGAAAWPGPTPVSHGTSAASSGDGAVPAGSNPFLSQGVVRNLKPSDLPKNAALRWKVDYHADASYSTALPQAGMDGVCGGFPGGIETPEQQYTSLFTGAGDAKARYRISKYADPGQAQDAIRGLEQALRDCGLKGQLEGGYSGRTNANGPWLEVSVRQWGAWVGVTEAQFSPTS
ncbi:hypothetical protein [Krasilnikovia sp. MM14-A1259]|uniref:hypothetical protein n=1 Tax=Krasilnikovia sp. MM14-A1259 TaxID=3373539 RepID=UPI0038020082